MTFLKYFLRLWKARPQQISMIVFVMFLVAFVETMKLMLVLPIINFFIAARETGANSMGLVGRVISLMENTCEAAGFEFSLGFVLIMMVSVYVIDAGLKLFLQHVQCKERLSYTFSLAHKLFKSYLSSSWSFFVHNKPGKLVNLLAVEVPRAAMAYWHLCLTLASFVVVAFAIFFAVLISWQLTLFMFIIVPIIFFVFKRFTRLSGKYGAATTQISNELQAEALENIMTAKMIKASSSEEKSIGLVDSLLKEWNRYYYLAAMNIELVNSLQEPLGIIVLALALYVSMGLMQIEPQSIALTLVVFFKITPRFYMIQRNYQQTISFIPALNEIDRMMVITDNSKEESGSIMFSKLEKGIEFKNVSFSYEKISSVLDDINLFIPKGKVIGIVGESGSGKSTIADMLVGLIHPRKGEVIVDGLPLKDYQHKFWRKSIGYVTQEMNLFHNTVRTNLTWNRADATQEEMEDAAKMAHAHEFIMEMPQKYDTVIGDRGFRLSGGQRQRLALARVILAQPQIFIFDEATSALDSESEEKIQKAIDKLSETHTTVIIAHRISTLRKADNIYVMKEGSVCESGSWEELIKKGGVFKNIASMQNSAA